MKGNVDKELILSGYSQLKIEMDTQMLINYKIKFIYDMYMWK